MVLLLFTMAIQRASSPMASASQRGDRGPEWQVALYQRNHCSMHLPCPIYADASLGPKELVAEYPDATFPDGFTFDSQGGVWAVSVASNRIIHVDVNGNQAIVLEDADAKEMAR